MCLTANFGVAGSIPSQDPFYLSLLLIQDEHFIVNGWALSTGKMPWARIIDSALNDPKYVEGP